MTELAGAIGEGRLLVFQPATPTGAGLEIALGIQRFWQKTMKHAGRDAACILAFTRIESISGTLPDGMPIAVGDRGVACLQNWSDPLANAHLVVAQECRWGLITTFTPTETRGRLETILIEPRDAGSATLGSWTFDSTYDTLPAHLVEVIVDVARRLGTRLPWKSPSEAFDSGDPGAAMVMLEQMGVLSMAEDGCRVIIPLVLDRLALLAGTAPRSSVVVALVPELLGHLARLGAHDLQLAGWMRRVKSAIGVLPPGWDGLVDRLSRERGHN